MHRITHNVIILFLLIRIAVNVDTTSQRMYYMAHGFRFMGHSCHTVAMARTIVPWNLYVPRPSGQLEGVSVRGGQPEAGSWFGSRGGGGECTKWTESIT